MLQQLCTYLILYCCKSIFRNKVKIAGSMRKCNCNFARCCQFYSIGDLPLCIPLAIWLSILLGSIVINWFPIKYPFCHQFSNLFAYIFIVIFVNVLIFCFGGFFPTVFKVSSPFLKGSYSLIKKKQKTKNTSKGPPAG